MGRNIGFLKGLLFTYLKYNCEEGSVGILKGSLLTYLKYNCEEGRVGFLKDRYSSICSTIVGEEA